MLQKGRLHVGADADITVFDAERVLDRSTYREPSLSPVGIEHVIVNGVSVVATGQAVENVAPGKPVRAPINDANPSAKRPAIGAQQRALPCDMRRDRLRPVSCADMSDRYRAEFFQ